MNKIIKSTVSFLLICALLIFSGVSIDASSQQDMITNSTYITDSPDTEGIETTEIELNPESDEAEENEEPEFADTGFSTSSYIIAAIIVIIIIIVIIKKRNSKK